VGDTVTLREPSPAPRLLGDCRREVEGKEEWEFEEVEEGELD